MLSIGIFFLLMYLPFVILPVLSLTGAIYIIANEIISRRKAT